MNYINYAFIVLHFGMKLDMKTNKRRCLTMLDQIKKLINVRSITTIALIATFNYLAIAGRITPDNFMIIITSVITFYFTYKTNKDV